MATYCIVRSPPSYILQFLLLASSSRAKQFYQYQFQFQLLLLLTTSSFQYLLYTSIIVFFVFSPGLWLRAVLLLLLLLLGLLLLMSLFCRAKNLSPPTMRDSVVQFYNMKSLIVGCWNDLTSTHKLPFALVFGGSTHLVVIQYGICLKSCRSNGGGSSWPHNSLRWRTRGVGR